MLQTRQCNTIHCLFECPPDAEIAFHNTFDSLFVLTELASCEFLPLAHAKLAFHSTLKWLFRELNLCVCTLNLAGPEVGLLLCTCQVRFSQPPTEG